MKILIKNEICESVNTVAKVVVTVYVPYMNSVACWGKGVKKKKKRENARNLKHNKRNMDPNSALVMANRVGLVRLQS